MYLKSYHLIIILQDEDDIARNVRSKNLQLHKAHRNHRPQFLMRLRRLFNRQERLDALQRETEIAFNGTSVRGCFHGASAARGH